MSVFCPAEKSFWLHKLCEANFERLNALIPELSCIDETASAVVQGKPVLLCRPLDRSAYTLTLELTHDFPAGLGAASEPAVRIRVCFDAGVAEVICDHCRPVVLEALSKDRNPRDVLDYKWDLNYFLSRWLDHCLSSDYRFGVPCSAEDPEPCCAG